MSDTLSHLLTSFLYLKSCLNIILRHLAHVKIFSFGENLIPGELGQIWHIWALATAAGQPVCAPDALARCAACAPDARLVHSACARWAPSAPDTCQEARAHSGRPCVCAEWPCVRPWVPGWASSAPTTAKNQSFFLIFHSNLFQTTSQHFITLQNLSLWYVWLQTLFGQNFSFKFWPSLLKILQFNLQLQLYQTFIFLNL